MLKIKRIKLISFILTALLLLDSFSGLVNSGTVYAEESLITIPELLITEVVFDPSGRESTKGDVFEYVELYNSSDHPINLNDYKLVYRSISSTTNTTCDIAANAVIRPGDTAVVWIYNNDAATYCGSYEEADDDTNELFRIHYDAAHKANSYDYPVYRINAAQVGLALINSLYKNGRTIEIVRDNNELICSAKYNYNKVEATSDHSVTYKYPSDSSKSMAQLGTNQVPTPGSVTVDQVPENNIIDFIAPVIEHSKPLENMSQVSDLKIIATTTDESVLHYTYLMYETYNTSVTKAVYMNAGASPNTYEYTIPAADISGSSYVKYYIEAYDGHNFTTSPADRNNPFILSVGDMTPPVVTITSPANEYTYKNIYRPTISAEYSDASGIDTDRVKLYLNGSDVTDSAAVTVASITYSPAVDLLNGEYTVSLSVYDKSPFKNKTEQASKFTITTGKPIIPELLMTEILPNPSGSSGDTFEFAEIYNSSDHDINLKDYKLMYVTDQTKPTTYLTDDMTESAVIKSGETAVVWFYNQASVKDCGAYEAINDDVKNQFRGQYATADDSSSIDSSILIYPVNANMEMTGLNYFTLQNSGVKTLLLARDSGEFVCQLTYNGSSDTNIQDRSAIYKYPSDDSITMQLIGKNQVPTPGKITYEQKPVNYDDKTAPVIGHTKPMDSMMSGDLTITALAADETELRSVKLYYETGNTSGIKAADMLLSKITANTYEYTISEAEISGSSYIKYYIEASDGANTVTCPTDKNIPFEIAVVDGSGPEINIMNPVPNNCFVNYHKPVIQAAFSDASGIDTDSVKLYLNGKQIVTAQISNTGIIYTPEENLSDGKYIVRLEASDNSSASKNTTIRQWAFTVVTADISASPSVPELLITEVMANPTAGFDSNNKLIRTNLYEFVELYNASRRDINLKDYKLMYIPDVTKPNDLRTDDIIDDVVLYPGQTIAVWIYNDKSKAYFSTGDSSTLDQSTKDLLISRFRSNYNLKANIPVIMVDGDSVKNPLTAFNLDNTNVKTIIVAKDTAAAGEYICTADYNNDPDLNYDALNKSMTYICPGDSSIKMAALKPAQDPTPGAVTYEQIPLNSFDMKAPVIEHQPPASSMELDSLSISATISEETQLHSAKLCYETFNTQKFVSIDMTESQTETGKFTAAIPLCDIAGSTYVKYYIEADDGIHVSTFPIQKNSPITISVKDTQGPVIKSVKPSDSLYVENNSRPVISAEYSDASGVDIQSVKMYLDGKDITTAVAVSGTAVTYTPLNDLTEGDHGIKLVLSDCSTQKNTSEKAWSFRTGPEQYNFYKGQIHSHSNYSDGVGNAAGAYAFARDTSKADFFGLTDHANYLDEKKWSELTAIADVFNKTDKFITIPGFELTWDSSMGWWGHINSFNTGWIESKRNNSSVNLPNYYKRLSNTPQSFSQFNHPGFLWGDFAKYGYYNKEADEAIDLMEVKTLEQDAEYAMALDKGWHISPCNNEDNHSGNWAATSNSTVVLAPRLTRENLMAAVKQNRTYATQDKNLKIIYKINNEIMGATLNNPEKLSVSIKASHPSQNIGTITVFADGHSIVTSGYFDTTEAEWNFELPALYSYYYIRIDMPNSKFAVTAPVWVENLKPLALHDLSIGNNIENTGSPVQLRANAVNTGNMPVTDIKIEYFRNNTNDGNKICEKNISTINPGADKAIVSNIPFVSLYRTIYLKISGKVGDVTVVDVMSINIPELMITEIMPASSCGLGDTAAPYEYIEIYNNSDKPLDIANYKIEYYTGSGAAVAQWDITDSRIIQPRGVLVIWLKPNAVAVTEKTVNDFNARYGTGLNSNQIVELTGKTLDDTGGKTLFITHDSSKVKLSQARYNVTLDLNKDVTADKSIQYKYPADGTDILEKTASGATATPGTVMSDQVPYLVNPADAALSSIMLSGGTLSPAFDPSVTNYTLSVKRDTSTISITPTVSSEVYKSLTVNGVDACSGGSYIVNVPMGQSSVEIVVTAQNQSVQIYTITISRSGSSNTDYYTTSGKTTETGSAVNVVKAELDSKSGQARAVIEGGNLTNMLEKAEPNADGVRTAAVDIPKVEGANSYILVLPTPFLTRTDTLERIELKTEFATVTVPSGILSDLDSGAVKEAGISIRSVNKVELPDEVRSLIGGHPVIDLNVLADGKVVEYNKPEAPVTVKIPYTPTPEELKSTDHIVVWYIDGQGIAVPVTNGRYDALSQTVIFCTTHFSQFAVAYVYKTFEDLQGFEWAKAQIEAMASKGVINGVSGKEFKPGAQISRADYVLLLVKALGLTAKVDSNFTDVSRDAYYYETVRIAKALGLVKGCGDNSFAPEADITRQEMLVMTARALRITKKLDTIGIKSDLEAFTDLNGIADYAVNDIAAMVKEGIIKGGDGRINPLADTTRAEAAVLIYRIYNK